MTDTIMYSQQRHNLYYHDSDGQPFYNFILPDQQQKPQRRPSFSTLLQSKTSMLGRKLSIFSRQQKKSQLKLIIPSMATPVQHNNNISLERMDTSASNSTTDGEDGPVTPTSSCSVYYNDNRASTISSQDLESAITTPSASTTPLMDYSGKGYSNFYIKLPNGNWMVRVRDGNRKIVGTFEIDGSMI